MPLGCIDCRDARNTCGPTMSSACVWFTGSFSKFINQDDIDCRVNLNDMFKLYGDEIDALIADTNITSLDPRCLGYDTNSITHVKLEDIQNKNICDLKTTLTALVTEVQTLDIGALPVTVDLKCMKSANSACAVAPDTYPLVTILNIIINKLCP